MTGWDAYAQTAKPIKDKTMFYLQSRTRNAHYIANVNLRHKELVLVLLLNILKKMADSLKVY